MQFSSLAGFQKQIQALDEKRSQRSQGDYMKGLYALKRAKESNFTDRKALKRANHLLLCAVQKNRSNSKPLVALGYLLIILGDGLRARRYLTAALQLESANTEAEALLQCVAKLGSSAAVEKQLDHLDRGESQSDTQEISLKEAELDYERLNRLMYQGLIEWMAVDLNTPCWDLEQLSEQTLQFEKLAQLCARLRDPIQRLDAFLDTGPLAQFLERLERLNQRAQSTLALSQECVAMGQNLNAQVEAVLSLYQGSLNVNESQLETLLDQCDLLADRLDALSERTNIDSLVVLYEELISLVNRLQNELDEQG